MDVLKELGRVKVIPVIALENAADAAPLADALAAGGLPIAEVTFRTAAAADAIGTMAKAGNVLVGAGTVLSVDVVKRAVDRGAKFIVSPGFSQKVVSYCVENKIPILPGTATPTDVQMALEHGLNTVKFFPAESVGGLKTLKAISAPFGMMNFVPTGGISAENLAEYLKFPKILACGGSWMVSNQLLAAKEFGKVTELCKEAVAIANSARPK